MSGSNNIQTDASGKPQPPDRQKILENEEENGGFIIQWYMDGDLIIAS